MSECPRTADYLPWLDTELRRDPYPFYARALEEAPVSLDEDGAIVLTKYDDLMHYGRLPSVIIAPEWEKAGAWSVLLDAAIGHDEPNHTRLKRLTSKWLTPKRIREWVKITEAVTDEILDRVDTDGVIDGSDLAVEATHRTICHLLQVPDDEIDEVRRHMRQAMPMLSAVPSPADIEACTEAHIYLQNRTAALIERSRAQPGSGLVDDLLQAQDRGELTEAETLATLLFFYFVGHMDASYLISSGLKLFASRPDLFETFRSDPDSRQAMVAELVRFDAPEPVITRATTEDLNIHGYRVPAGTTLRLMLGAANRDPDIYSNPHEFDHTRPPEQSRNLTFSFGSHSCQGRLLAEAEIKAVWERIGARYSRVEVVAEPEMMLTDASRHYLTLPLRLHS
ncbi:cytochrome P450 [Rhodococcus triatomae]|nr:flavodoxin-cytochrome P450 XplA [Rhodococcus triatomae BKS 15-14]